MIIFSWKDILMIQLMGIFTQKIVLSLSNGFYRIRCQHTWDFIENKLSNLLQEKF